MSREKFLRKAPEIKFQGRFFFFFLEIYNTKYRLPE